MNKTPGGTPGNSWWGCAARFFKSWPCFRPKNVISVPHPFSDQTFKIHTRFQTWSLGREYLHKSANKKILQIHFEFAYFSFLLELKHLNTFTHSRSSLKKIRFQTQIGKVCTRFQTKTAQKSYPMGQQIPLCKGVPPPPGIKQKTLHLAVCLIEATILDRIKWNSNPPSCPSPPPVPTHKKKINDA